MSDRWVYLIDFLDGTLTLLFSLSLFPGQTAHLFQREQFLGTVVRCIAVSLACTIAGLPRFVESWVLPIVALFLGIAIAFRLSFRSTCAVFAVDFLLLQSLRVLLSTLS